MLSELAELQGRSIGKIVRELLDGALPGLAKVVQLGHQYRSASDEAKTLMHRAVLDADEAIAPELILYQTAFDELMRRVEEVSNDAV